MHSEFGGYCSILLPSLLLIVEIILTAGDTRWRIRLWAAVFPDISHHGVWQLVSFSVENEFIGSSLLWKPGRVRSRRSTRSPRSVAPSVTDTRGRSVIPSITLTISVCLLLRNHTTSFTVDTHTQVHLSLSEQTIGLLTYKRQSVLRVRYDCSAYKWQQTNKKPSMFHHHHHLFSQVVVA